MLIKLKNKDTLIFDEFKFKCSIGKKGIKKNKYEGDKSTPSGIYELGHLYYRSDRTNKPVTKINTKIIKKITNLIFFSFESGDRISVIIVRQTNGM